MHPLDHGNWLRSPGGGFAYKILGPCCLLFDREELPWPSCSLVWKGKQPSWNRVGPRFVADLAASQCPSYAVDALDQWGNRWTQVVTVYYQRLTKEEKQWWITRKPASKQFPELPTSR
jgi:hypothetical protein